MSSGTPRLFGREARAAARRQAGSQLRARTKALITDRMPWLLQAELDMPLDGRAQLLALQDQILRQAGSQSEAASMNAYLQDVVDRHNASNSTRAVAGPGTMAAVYSKDDTWRLEDLAFLRDAQRLRQRYDVFRAEELNWHAPAAQIFGLCLASAVFDSACLTPDHLQLFAQTLLDEDSVLHAHADVPIWMDLKDRGRRLTAKTRVLSVVSGKDGNGVYALRRLFLAPSTARLISLFWNLPAAARKEVLLTRPLIDHIFDALGMPTPASLRLPQLMRGTALLREGEQGGPDHLLTGLARRQIKSFAATPETWTRGLTPGLTATEILRKPPAVWVRELSAPARQHHRALLHPVLQTTAYLRFYMAIHDIAPEGEEGDDRDHTRQRTRAEMARDLRAARADGKWPDVLCLLSDWYLHLLEKDDLRPSSVERYDDTLGLRLCLHLEDLPFADLSAEDLEDLYSEILEDDPRSAAERRNLVRRLQSLHAFGVKSGSLPKIDPEIFSMDGDRPALRVRANFLAWRDIDAARLSLATEFSLPTDLARTLQAAFLLMARCGLRIGEICKAMASHFENPEGTAVAEEQATLFIRSSRFGTNKTANALRKIRPLLLMSKEERKAFSDWLAWRRSLSPSGPLFGISMLDGSVAPLDRVATGKLFAMSLRRATGLTMVSAHDLRRAALTNIGLALAEARASPVDGTRQLTGWSLQDRTAVVQAVAGVSLRERWEALARFAGHGSIETTFLHYITCADLLVWQACARQVEEGTESGLQLITGEATSRLLRHAPESRDTAPRREGADARLPQDSEAALQSLKIALDCLDRGLPLMRAASAANLPPEVVRHLAEVAKRWSEQRSARGQLRLQDKEDDGRLQPASLPAPKHQEALDIAARLIYLAKAQPDAVAGWIRMTLSQASRTNAGVVFRSPSVAKAWIEIAVQLRPAERWQFDRVSPSIDPDLRREREALWQGVRPEAMRRAARRVGHGNSVQARLRLMAPDVSERQGARPAGSWAGVVTVAAHFAAIWLRITPDDVMQDHGEKE